jgi:hypothetical protein
MASREMKAGAARTVTFGVTHALFISDFSHSLLKLCVHEDHVHDPGSIYIAMKIIRSLAHGQRTSLNARQAL